MEGQAKTKTAILVVSFGTSFPETRAKTIDQIEADIAVAFPGCGIYHAWTSQVIIGKLLKRDGIKIPTIEEAIEQILSDGITRLIVQPTHLLSGIENDQMRDTVNRYASDFASISFGDPLLTTTEDCRQAIQAIMMEFTHLQADEALVLMGHGTIHQANSVYGTLDRLLKDLGYPNVFLGTVEASPSLDTLIKKISPLHPKKVLLAPFLVVAGDHATHDMSGEHENSWRSRFEAAGFTVASIMKGLGEYPGIRKLYLEHAKAAEQNLQKSNPGHTREPAREADRYPHQAC